eukprot:402305-Pleurochrysis_carterae.AAC.1
MLCSNGQHQASSVVAPPPPRPGHDATIQRSTASQVLSAHQPPPRRRHTVRRAHQTRAMEDDLLVAKAPPPVSPAVIKQSYEGHGVAIPPPLDQGFPATSLRPKTEVKKDASSSRRKRSQQRPKVLLIHVHLRDKVMPISVGEGKQCIYWLAVNAVQRYVMDENSYTRTFSEELTPKAVLDTQLLQIDNKARIKDELQDGAHVWVDVGDGVPISEVNSRPFELQPETGDEVADQEVSWELDPEDKRLVMRYQRSTSKAHLSFEQWRMTSQKQFLDDYQDPSADDQAENPLYETFKTCWKQIRLSDIPVRVLQTQV